MEKKSIYKGAAVLGALLIMLTVLLTCKEIFLAAGGVVYIVYQLCRTFLTLPLCVISAVLAAVLSVQAAKEGYSSLRLCFIAVLSGIVLVAAGVGARGCLAPAVARGITAIKLRGYERTVERAGTGEDTAFYQYNVYHRRWDDEESVIKTRDVYILYSEDDRCDAEGLLEEGYSFCTESLSHIRDNWYCMTVDNYFYP